MKKCANGKARNKQNHSHFGALHIYSNHCVCMQFCDMDGFLPKHIITHHFGVEVSTVSLMFCCVSRFIPQFSSANEANRFYENERCCRVPVIIVIVSLSWMPSKFCAEL